MGSVCKLALKSRIQWQAYNHTNEVYKALRHCTDDSLLFLLYALRSGLRHMQDVAYVALCRYLLARGVRGDVPSWLWESM